MAEVNIKSFAVVTGGSNGIGFELAKQFASNGYDVLIAAKDEAHLQKAAAQLGSIGAAVTTHAADLSTTDGVNSLYAAVRGKRCFAPTFRISV